MIQALLSRTLSAPSSPTADLYFMNACALMVGAGIERVSPTVFRSSTATLVMRHDLRSDRRSGGRKLIYFIDDAVEEGVNDASLPFLYRQKLRLVERASARRVGREAAIVVVSSAGLARNVASGVETHQIHPYWSEPIAGQQHFAPLMRGEGWIDIAYLGSRVHRGDLELLWPVIGTVLAGNRRVRFHLSECHRVPVGLACHPRIVRVLGRGWRAYREGLSARRFHLALYPLMETPFNRGRSLNKLIEHAVVGAAALYSRSWAESWRIEDGRGGLALANDRGAWLAAIEHLLVQPGAMRELAVGAGDLAKTLNDPEPQRRLWSELMGVSQRVAA